jgi:hypothetical protein
MPEKEPRSRRLNRFVEAHRALIELVGLIIALLVLLTYRHANELTQRAIQLNQDGLALNEKGLNELRETNRTNRSAVELNEKSLELTRESVLASQEALKLAKEANEISKKGADLTQQMVESSKEELAVAQKAYEISERSLIASSTPWVGARMISVTKVANSAIIPSNSANGVIAYNDGTGKITESSLAIRYLLENHSDSSALNVWSECFLENLSGYIDRAMVSEDSIAIMPRQEVKLESSILLEAQDPQDVIRRIKSGEIINTQSSQQVKRLLIC